MQRQKSILSFMRKPAPDGQKPVGVVPNGQGLNRFQEKELIRTDTRPSFALNLDSDQVRRIDTPPEKAPRRIFAADDDDDEDKPSLFSSIKHKFVRLDSGRKSAQRDKSPGGSSNVHSPTSKLDRAAGALDECFIVETLREEDVPILHGKVKQEGRDRALLIQDDYDLGPETPGMQPLVPRLKRVQDCPSFVDRNDCSLVDASKRVKLLLDTNIENKRHEDLSEMASKFEWLHPSQIKDANRRRPNDPLYDKRTLYIPPDALKKMSASQRQYWDVKCKYMDIVLFFKVGKFYELYELDAEIGHMELDWKMTLSGVGKCRQVGISESGIDEAVQKLIARGYKVGRMEQLETSEQAKSRGATSVIKRKLFQVLTSSTATDNNIGPDAVHLLAIKEDECGLKNGSASSFGFAFVDCAALKFWVGSVDDDSSCAVLGALLMQVSPKEVIYGFQGLSKDTQKALKKYLSSDSSSPQLNAASEVDFIDSVEVRKLVQLKGYFKGSLNAWDHTFKGLVRCDLALCALGGLINHLSRLMLDDVLRNGDILSYEVYGGCVRMDGQTLVNLEIFNNNVDGGPSGTLYKYMDNCITSSGKRLLRSWICHPLKDVEKINKRLSVVEELMAHSEAMLLIVQYFRKLPDLERLLARVKASLQSSASLVLPMIGIKVLKNRVKAFGHLVKGLKVGMEMIKLLQNEGLIISSVSKVAGISSLDGSDGLGKFLAQFDAAIDSDFPNYQDHNVTESDAETLSILTELFVEKADQWTRIIHILDCIDVLRSFAVTANFSQGAMSKPIILPHSKSLNWGHKTKGPILKMKGLWHPYALAENGVPVPNDIYLGEDADGCHPCTLLLTGPNMGGKSTLLRATCLAMIMAQLGCYVPCELCVISLVDIIFTRLGACDRIMTGESTFLVECTETASILQSATQDSLVILDELGRGTSTFDGYAIAYAVFRHLVEKVNCRLLFATHYHPLTKEFACHPHVTLQHMACAIKSEKSSKSESELVFLYRLASGACPESYGMQVALLAGIPKVVVEVASVAGQAMKKSIRESFRLSEQRSEFSTIHEEWLKTLLAISRIEKSNLDSDDTFDTLFCLWHEMKSTYGFADK